MLHTQIHSGKAHGQHTVVLHNQGQSHERHSDAIQSSCWFLVLVTLQAMHIVTLAQRQNVSQQHTFRLGVTSACLQTCTHTWALLASWLTLQGCCQLPAHHMLQAW